MSLCAAVIVIELDNLADNHWKHFESIQRTRNCILFLLLSLADKFQFSMLEARPEIDIAWVEWKVQQFAKEPKPLFSFKKKKRTKGENFLNLEPKFYQTFIGPVICTQQTIQATDQPCWSMH